MSYHNKTYILDPDRLPVQVDDYTAYLWHETDWEKRCLVARTELIPSAVSTIFFTMPMPPTDGSWSNWEPVLFETQVFGGDKDGYVRRYRTWAEAEVGHKEVCQMVLDELGN